MPEPITVLLPIHRWDGHTDDAIGSIIEQTHQAFELLLIVNGPDAQSRAKARVYELRDPRIRMIEHPEPSLPKALNLGIEHAKYELIARMDSDDWSHPDRLAIQGRFMQANPSLGGCGVGTSIVDPDGSLLHAHLPPTSSEETRWRVLIWNPFVHGSMMIRKQAVQSVGGYDETLLRAQDYDLWIRLAGFGLSGIPSILYTHRSTRRAISDATASGLDDVQSAHTAEILTRAWAGLSDRQDPMVQPIMAEIARGDASARSQLEHLMQTRGPTRQMLMAWMWSCWRHPVAPTDHAQRSDRISGTRDLLCELGISRVWLWGAGDLARSLLAEREALGVQVVGVVDDFRAGSAINGLPIAHSDELPAIMGEHEAVLIASDLYEQAIWDRSASHRSKGIRVIRLVDSSCPSAEPVP